MALGLCTPVAGFHKQEQIHGLMAKFRPSTDQSERSDLPQNTLPFIPFKSYISFIKNDKLNSKTLL